MKTTVKTINGASDDALFKARDVLRRESWPHGAPQGRDGDFKRAMAENSVQRMRQYRYGEKRRETAR